MRANVDQNVCIGCGLCAGMVPEVFRMNDDGKAEAYQDAAPENESMVQGKILVPAFHEMFVSRLICLTSMNWVERVKTEERQRL